MGYVTPEYALLLFGWPLIILKQHLQRGWWHLKQPFLVSIVLGMFVLMLLRNLLGAMLFFLLKSKYWFHRDYGF